MVRKFLLDRDYYRDGAMKINSVYSLSELKKRRKTEHPFHESDAIISMVL